MCDSLFKMGKCIR